MPKSRSRKKKRKKNNSNNSSKKQKKVVNGIEFILDGKNVLVKNKRTKEEHDLFIQKLIEQRPLIFSSIEESVNEVVEIFKSYDNFILLGHLAYNHFQNINNSDDDGLSEVTLEYGLSFSAAIEKNSSASPTKAICSRLSDLLILIRRSYKNYLGTEVLTGKYTE